jgi:hypothetical protein
MGEADGGSFGQQLGMGRYVVPSRVEVSADTVRWRVVRQLRSRSAMRFLSGAPIPDDDLFAYSEPLAGVLGRFLRLDLAKAEAVERFVRRWGVLAPGPPGIGVHDSQGSEPLKLWRALQADLVTIFDWHSAKRRGRPELSLVNTVASDDGWVGLRRPERWPRRAGRVLRFNESEFALTDVGTLYVEAMLSACRPVLAYGSRGVRARLPGLVAVLALQVGAALQGRSVDGTDRALASCSACGNPFSTSRQPRADQHAWCPADECQLEAARTRQRRRRERQRPQP